MSDDESLPPYSYVPGRFPHPLSDPAGHSFAERSESVAPLDPNRWRESRHFCRALRLFDAGYYWEAHEAWEALWLAAGRTGPDATALKALIKLAAAGVKARAGNADGVRRHARRAAELFHTARNELGQHEGPAYWAGIDLAGLAAACTEIASRPEDYCDADPAAVKVVLPARLSDMRQARDAAP
ncbi:MAG: DUF309 domain-containing protein [Pirellulales bacterium]